MKKLKMLFAMCLTVGLMLICLAGCNSSNYSDSPYVGQWVSTTCGFAEDEMDAYNTSDFLDGNMVFEFEADGTASMSIENGSSSTDYGTGKWEPTDDGLRIYNDNDESEFNLKTDDNGNLYCSMTTDGVTVYMLFEKQ